MQVLYMYDTVTHVEFCLTVLNKESNILCGHLVCEGEYIKYYTEQTSENA